MRTLCSIDPKVGIILHRLTGTISIYPLMSVSLIANSDFCGCFRIISPLKMHDRHLLIFGRGFAHANGASPNKPPRGFRGTHTKITRILIQNSKFKFAICVVDYLISFPPNWPRLVYRLARIDPIFSCLHQIIHLVVDDESDYLFGPTFVGSCNNISTILPSISRLFARYL